MARLFIAAWPPAEIIDAVRGLPRPDEPGVTWVPERNWHITLRFLGEADLDAVVARLETVTLPRATARLGPVIERLDARHIVVPAVGVDELAAAARAITAELGTVDRRRFQGHLTVARTRPRAASRVIGTPFSGSWDISNVAVVESALLRTGAVYSTVATFATS
jgi:2'-5' RNA ligase